MSEQKSELERNSDKRLAEIPTGKIVEEHSLTLEAALKVVRALIRTEQSKAESSPKAK